MKTWLAILFAIALLAVCIAIMAVMRVNITLVMVLGTSIWAAIDSMRIGLRNYKSGISYGPLVLFSACALLWIVGFPWYLSVRYKIKTGTAVLKNELAPANT